ncbi:unnamed protein product, partial [Porites evermanni]
MPNMFNHDTQEEAALEVHQFWPLVEMKCSPDLKIFLCSVYAPKCELHAKENEFPPCRSLCESARNGCEPLMRQYGFSLPEGFRCKQFPKLGQNKTCLHSNVTETTQASTTLSTTLAVSPTGKISNWRKCEKIKISMCENTGYNSTYMPNMFNHHTQAEAALELHKFWLLVKVNCSLELKRFLCHIYVPRCEPHKNNVLLPCRRLCRRVRTDCASFMNQHNIDWPHQMNCENFPELGDDKTCLDPEAVGTRHKDVKRCEKIKIPMCENIGYNLTYMPNMFNHDTQEEAALDVHQFWPLVEIRCSPDLKIFLCTVFAPKCELHAKENEFPPCRSLCERARKGCAPLMRQYGFSWPERLRCKQFPKLGQNKTCLDSKVTEKTQVSTTLSTTLAVSPTGKISNWRKCEKIKISMCENTGYNLTYMPNMFNHHTQAEAALELHKFWLLVKVNCSLELKRFLCHIYVPKCEPHINNVLLPCRRLCRRVRTDCASFMNQHNIDWPHQMNCENFPELGDDKTCLDPEAV